jgi:hypothetical protein
MSILAKTRQGTQNQPRRQAGPMTPDFNPDYVADTLAPISGGDEPTQPRSRSFMGEIGRPLSLVSGKIRGLPRAQAELNILVNWNHIERGA